MERLRSGDVRALARSISLVENQSSLATEILACCFPYSGKALRIGITGAPGAGKSTLVDQLARDLRAAGKTIGVLAVDPTSPYSGGAILGDRIRMQEHFNDAGFYLRSMATRGALGGLARASADAATVLEASGKDVLLMETVGVGQDEIDIVRLADITVVVLVPGMGDDVQSLKAGILEIADIFVINKSDREGADRVEKEIRGMQSLAARHGDWVPPILRTVATSGSGIPELLAAIRQCHQRLQTEAGWKTRRQAFWRERLREMMRHELLLELGRRGFSEDGLAHHAEEVEAGMENPYRLVPRLVSEVFPAEGRTQPGGSGLPAIDHLGIAVKSLEAATSFYALLGLQAGEEEHIEREQVRLAMIQLGESRIELLEPTSEDSPVGRFLARRGEGLHHLALRVENIESHLAELKRRGVRLVSDTVQIGAGGHLYFFVHPGSTGGVLLEICQHLPEKP
ncbi:MAG TPA: methylmalonyl Co-A mutase-associated GTPase MeaB [Acidisarcina sp.]|nr:methylmalonyl Co-A mutase-associated GTPase MeaB [Acidisarcina sp.]